MSANIEITIDNISSLESALQSGATSLEICSSLCLGGLTPNAGFVQKSLDLSHIPIHVIIRPRTGNFVYTDTEIDIMVSDIKFMQLLGVQGVTFAALKQDGNLDIYSLQRLVRAARGLEVTFNRAFDLLASYPAMDKLIELGFDRIITSGQDNLSNTNSINKLLLTNNSNIQVIPSLCLSQPDLFTAITMLNTKQIQLSPLNSKTNLEQQRFTIVNGCEQLCEECPSSNRCHDITHIINTIRA